MGGAYADIARGRLTKLGLGMLMEFAKRDALESLRFAGLLWLCVLVIHVGQTSFHPSKEITAWTLGFPILFLLTFAIRCGWFFAFYFRGVFDASYGRFRRIEPTK